MSAFTVGAIFGDFIIPAAIFWIFFRIAVRKENPWLFVIPGWLIGFFIIYASTLPTGKGFLLGLGTGHVIAIIFGVALTIHAIKKNRKIRNSSSS